MLRDRIVLTSMLTMPDWVDKDLQFGRGKTWTKIFAFSIMSQMVRFQNSSRPLNKNKTPMK
jgi:hypothetical protein